jgi:hypothetical protein
VNKSCCLLLAAFTFLQSCSNTDPDTLPQLAVEQTTWIGEQIFANECNLKIPCLTSWNAGEDFPSLGIGHFIWYRAQQSEAFVESFPQLVAYYQEQGIELPAWIAALPGMESPWQSREEFTADLDSARMIELRHFLNNTRHIQVEFIIRRMHASLPALLAHTSRPEQIATLLHEIAASDPPLGMYALIDYINFKGEGTAVTERYAGEGWGLLQVMEHLLDTRTDAQLMPQFAAAARHVLAQRIANAPAERQEQRWRAGWNNRTLTYEQMPSYQQQGGSN